MRLSRLKTSIRVTAFSLVAVFSILGNKNVHAADADDLIKHALSDVRVLYTFTDPETIDWPMIYYLNEEFGCRVDLLTIESHTVARHTVTSIRDRGIFLHRYSLPPPVANSPAPADSSTAADSTRAVPTYDDAIGGIDYGPIRAHLFADRLPDVVIFGEQSSDPLYTGLRTFLLERMPDSGFFRIRKCFESRAVSPAAEGGAIVTMNQRELYNRYRDLMDYEIPSLFSWYRISEHPPDHLRQYRQVKSSMADDRPDVGIVTGISQMRLLELIEAIVEPGPMRKTFLQQANKFISGYREALAAEDGARADEAIKGFRELQNLQNIIAERSEPTFKPLKAHVRNLMEKAQLAVLRVVGVGVTGDVVVRDSPHGPKIKYRLTASADGPREIELTDIRFQPFWDTASIALDTLRHTILPHQSLVREFLVEVDETYLETAKPESLMFTTQVFYGSIPLRVTNTLVLWHAPDLKIEFEPDFYFLPPVADVSVDHVVSSMNWKAVITKPRSFSGDVQFEFTPSRGIYAGAYRREVTLQPGTTRETIRIPFSVSNLFEEGIQEETITLSVDGRVVAADTGSIRIASCAIDDKIKTGFLPDREGLVEDILRLTGAGYQPLTDRTLVTGDLEAFDVIVIGSGALEDYPSIHLVKDRLHEFVREGGSIVVFGQREEDWQENALTVGIIPTEAYISSSQIDAKIPDAKLLSHPYQISVERLLTAFQSSRTAYPAVVAPAEAVLQTDRGEALLSVSRMGQGQIIYCGLPVLQLVSELNLDAIHLLANILNY